MNSIFYLTHREFSLQQAQASINGPDAQYNMIHRIPGICMVFFWSKSCKFCTTLEPIFKSLPGMISGVHFALANASADDMKIVKMSNASRTPIQYVPYIAVYVNGMFYTEYRGPKTAESMVRAMYEISAKVNSGKEFSTGKMCTAPSGQPAYCAEGGDDDTDVCYFTFDEAYNGKKETKSGKGSYYTYSDAYGK